MIVCCVFFPYINIFLLCNSVVAAAGFETSAIYAASRTSHVAEVPERVAGRGRDRDKPVKHWVVIRVHD